MGAAEPFVNSRRSIWRSVAVGGVSTLLVAAASCSSGADSRVAAYYREVDRTLAEFDEALKTVVSKAAAAPPEARRGVFEEELAEVTAQVATELAAIKPPPALLETHSANVAGWRRGLTATTALAYHCTGEHCYCIGDADCNRMFEEACEPGPQGTVCDETLGFPVCKCRRFLCC
jgi:hypothetical protein